MDNHLFVDSPEIFVNTYGPKAAIFKDETD
jgi:hypothetical protein